MKTKKFNEKLVLKKTTISNLTQNDLKAVKGGGPTSRPGPCVTVDGKTCQ
jgi:hypothetical protein